MKTVTLIESNPGGVINMPSPPFDRSPGRHVRPGITKTRGWGMALHPYLPPPRLCLYLSTPAALRPVEWGRLTLPCLSQGRRFQGAARE